MQKDLAKTMLKASGIPVPEGLVVSRFTAAKKHLLARPYVIKPIAEGSSVGVFIVTEEHEHPPQELYRDDWAFGDRVLVERYIPGKELTCAVMGDRALDVIEIVAATRFYDYEAKYAPGGSKHLLPAPVSPEVYEETRRLSLAAHRALGCRGVSRADFRYDDRAEGNGRAGLPRSQHAAGHDRDLARARARGPRGHFVRRAGALDGRGRLARAVSPRYQPAERSG